MDGVASPIVAASAAAVLMCSVWALWTFGRRLLVHGRCGGKMLPCDYLHKILLALGLVLQMSPSHPNQVQRLGYHSKCRTAPAW